MYILYSIYFWIGMLVSGVTALFCVVSCGDVLSDGLVDVDHSLLFFPHRRTFKFVQFLVVIVL